LNRVSKIYGGLTGKQLEDLSHAEAPYIGTDEMGEILMSLRTIERHILMTFLEHDAFTNEARAISRRQQGFNEGLLSLKDYSEVNSIL
jgi:hypothetical protein